MEKTFAITKWCATITDSGEDELTNRTYDGMPYQFRILDDDGEVYGYGYSKTNNDDAAFAPLDYYTGDYGVTSIEYFNEKTKEWEML